MTDDRINELEEKLAKRGALYTEDCLELIGEVRLLWRLRSIEAVQAMEADKRPARRKAFVSHVGPVQETPGVQVPLTDARDGL